MPFSFVCYSFPNLPAHMFATCWIGLSRDRDRDRESNYFFHIIIAICNLQFNPSSSPFTGLYLSTHTHKMATLTVPDQLPPVADDCERLHNAFQGWGTDEGAIISILAHRNAKQRSLIRQTYTETYGEDLLKSLDKELSSDFERVVLLWTLQPAERDALLANESIRKLTPKHFVILEIACTRTPRDLFLVKEEYHARFKRSIEEDVAQHTTGDFRRLLVPLVTAYRYDGPEVNATLATSEAKILHEKISEKAYNDEELIRIISTRSKAQLNATFNHYNDQFGNAINKDLKIDPDNEYLKLLRSAIKCLTWPEKYFEKVLRLAIKGLGTDEEALTRVVVTRAEVDMKCIVEEYYRRSSVPLDQVIKGDTSGDYEGMLLALIGNGSG